MMLRLVAIAQSSGDGEIIHEADEMEAEIVVRREIAHHPLRRRAGADDDRPLDPDAALPELIPHEPADAAFERQERRGSPPRHR